MQYITFAILASATFASAAVDSTTVNCEAQMNVCRTSANANQAFCSAQYADCRGGNPYTNNPAPSATKPAPVTQIGDGQVQATTAAPPTASASCQKKADMCRSKPNANQAVCSAELAACLGYNPYTHPASTKTLTSPVPSSSAECQAAADKCRTAPDANQASCSAELAACLGYNPYTSQPAVYTTKIVTQFTTVCPESTTFTHGTHTYTATKGETVTVTNCPCTVTHPAVPTSTPSCEDKMNACRTAPNANQAVCSSDYATCLGYNPYTSQAPPAPSKPVPVSQISDGQIQATAAGPAPVTTKPATPAPTQSCEDKMNACRTAPNANQAVCSADYATCLGYNPYTSQAPPAATTPVPVSQISDGQIQATHAPAPAPGTSKENTPVAPSNPAPVTQISDGQIQATTAAPAPVPTTVQTSAAVVSSTPVPVTQISDGQIQATTAAAPTAKYTGAASANKVAGAVMAAGIAAALL